MTESTEGRGLFRQVRFTVLLLIAICSLLVVKFTTRSTDEKERARARVLLSSIYTLQQNHHNTRGTYLSSRRANTSDVLKWAEVPGRFQYEVTTEYGKFQARAIADFNGDGRPEIWQVDPQHPEPVRIQID